MGFIALSSPHHLVLSNRSWAQKKRPIWVALALWEVVPRCNQGAILQARAEPSAGIAVCTAAYEPAVAQANDVSAVRFGLWLRRSAMIDTFVTGVAQRNSRLGCFQG